jgi:hypothetical protein
MYIQYRGLHYLVLHREIEESRRWLILNFRGDTVDLLNLALSSVSYQKAFHAGVYRALQVHRRGASCNARCLSTVLSTQPLIVVRVVDYTKILAARCPAERGLASDTPHLVASVDFADTLSTLGAGLRIFLNEGSSCLHSLIAGVSRILLFTLRNHTIRADPCLTGSALPGTNPRTHGNLLQGTSA